MVGNGFYFRMYSFQERALDVVPSKIKTRIAVAIRVFPVLWELLDSNQRPPACKAGALNQLS